MLFYKKWSNYPKRRNLLIFVDPFLCCGIVSKQVRVTPKKKRIKLIDFHVLPFRFKSSRNCLCFPFLNIILLQLFTSFTMHGMSLSCFSGRFSLVPALQLCCFYLRYKPMLWCVFYIRNTNSLLRTKGLAAVN